MLVSGVILNRLICVMNAFICVGLLLSLIRLYFDLLVFTRHAFFGIPAKLVLLLSLYIIESFYILVLRPVYDIIVILILVFGFLSENMQILTYSANSLFYWCF